MAEAAVVADTGFYFYGVVAPGSDVAGLTGLDEMEVELVEHGDLAAVVSRLPLERPPGRSAELVAHAHVVDNLAAVTTVVPAQFGLVLPLDLQEVVRVLDDSADGFRAALERLEGCLQLNLRATYVSEQVLTELVQQDPEVAELRRRTKDLPAGTPHPDLVRLGEAVSRGLTRKRLEDGDAVLHVVLPYVVGHLARPGGEYDVCDLALLVRRDRADALEKELEVMSEAIHERVRVRLVGPVAPYDFVEDGPWV